MRATGVVGDEERSFLVKERSGDEIKRYLEAHPEREEDLMTVLSYFDPMSFANDVRCPTLVGLGLLDDVVPAPRFAPSPDLSADRTRSSICPSATTDQEIVDISLAVESGTASTQELAGWMKDHCVLAY